MVATFTLALVIFIIVLALVFDFTNGFHDSANSIATIVSTKVLSPKKAVMMAAFFNFIAAFGFGVAVASTISKIVNIGVFDMGLIPYIVLGGLIGAIGWNITTWYLGLPTSSSHALIGGLAGSGVVAGIVNNGGLSGGLGAIKFETVKTVVIFMVVSPSLGFVLAFFFMLVVIWICRPFSQAKVNTWFKKLQLVSAAAYSFSHGTNDAQKTMGIIIPLLFSVGYYSMTVDTSVVFLPEGVTDWFFGIDGGPVDPLHLGVPGWVILSAHTAIALGTLCGGWRIVKTMGTRITRLMPVQGFVAETSGAISVLFATFNPWIGIPVSTTHIICSSIMGVGATKRASAVRWGVARSILVAWVLTIPMAGLIGAVSFFIINLFL